MLLKFKNLTIRNATVKDAPLLAKWWNDGTVMAHAGFPNGTGETVEEISERLKNDTDKYRRVRVHIDSWRDQIGELQSSIEYELYPEDFVNFAK